MKSSNYRLQFITHSTDRYTYEESARLALEGGCRWVQLRMKGAEESDRVACALAIQKMCRAVGATFIVDDDVPLARRIGADGVHLGKEDMPIAEARKILGEGVIIGATVNSFEDIEAHINGAMPDYFGCGPFRFTTTKKRLAPTLGIEGYRSIISRMREQDIAIPIVAIGGITKADIPQILATGIDGIALSGSVLQADNPVNEMQEIVSIINHFNN